MSQRCETANVGRSLDGARLNDFGLSLEGAKEIQFREAARVLDILVPATRPHNHRLPIRSKSGTSQAPIVSVAPASLPFPFSLITPIFARFPAIKAGIRDRDGTRCCARLSTASVCRCAEYRYRQTRYRSRSDARAIRRIYELINNLGTYLGQNAASIVNYCRRYWSGQPISSSPAESAANSLVNACMNKKRQMRWTRSGKCVGPDRRSSGSSSPSRRRGRPSQTARPRILTPSFFPLPRREPDLATLVRIADALGTSPNWLLGLTVGTSHDPHLARLGRTLRQCSQWHDEIRNRALCDTGRGDCRRQKPRLAFTVQGIPLDTLCNLL
ncbi:hypothetical protein SFHH103_psfHH103d_74 (plasmid) [Sinorhizobium fredii HH103]|uniref:HTH cro/C1-type domain-containing protein n=1 Tax=Sinorhizobium fredii (strain USDA 257) TaxID=1185652 RepID=I3XGZ6_SINF2|nr:hypothetical protein USDA257_p04370 [Sinorhizobium fredii USDA 257]CCE99247.1 hypothetical protein SFHH103_04777 [Sinorhizobium fredii HH103]CEO91271.1 hypothetical protein SFHH103_psfHH103d_74 [Sinorhizobium fredii HH103]